MGNLYVADANTSTIQQVQIANGSVTTVVGMAGQAGVRPIALPARLNHPLAVATLPTGELFILDENSVLLAH